MSLPINRRRRWKRCSVDEIPAGDGWQYEPKWDGFRCLAFRDGEKIYLQSKAGQPLARYFPEVVRSLSGLQAKQFVLDGELAIPGQWRAFVRRIATASCIPPPAGAKTGRGASGDFHRFRFARRNRWEIAARASRCANAAQQLEKFAQRNFPKEKPIRLSPATTSFRKAKKWFDKSAAISMASSPKRSIAPYASRRTRPGW